MRNDDDDQARPSGASVQETRLPGIGVRYEFVTDKGERVGVVHHRSGRRELVLYEARDPDCVAQAIELDEADSRTLAEMLGGAGVAERLTKLQQSVEGLAMDQLAVGAGSTYEGRTIGDTAARTRTGASIVAVLRKDRAFPAPGPDFKLEAGDDLVVVGTPAGIEGLSRILRPG